MRSKPLNVVPDIGNVVFEVFDIVLEDTLLTPHNQAVSDEPDCRDNGYAD
jgi:hypothetical protein